MGGNCFKSSTSSEESAKPRQSSSPKYITQHRVFKNCHLPETYCGLSFVFNGVIKLSCEKFCISFKADNSSRDIALLISPHLLERYIVRTNRLGNVWAVPEISSPLPFALRRGGTFAIQTLITDDCYMISVNGYHLAEYKHRMSYKLVACIEVTGEVEQLKVQFADFPTYPEKELPVRPISLLEDVDIPVEEESDYSLLQVAKSESTQETSTMALPYYGALTAKTFNKEHCLKLTGRVKLLPRSFCIDLQHGRFHWPHPIVAFRFHVLYKELVDGAYKNIVCCSAWKEGHWTATHRSDLTRNLHPGAVFNMFIISNQPAWEVYVNKALMVKFNSTVRPETLDTLCIQGDIKLAGVFMVHKAFVNKLLDSMFDERST